MLKLLSLKVIMEKYCPVSNVTLKEKIETFKKSVKNPKLQFNFKSFCNKAIKKMEIVKFASILEPRKLF